VEGRPPVLARAAGGRHPRGRDPVPHDPGHAPRPDLAGHERQRQVVLHQHRQRLRPALAPVDLSGKDNGFGRGLPPKADNEAKWPFQQPLLADPALKPTPADIASASTAADDLLRLRFSTPLFRLGTADLIEQKVSFPGSGPDADPGVVVMAIDDEPGWDSASRRWAKDVDKKLDGVLVVVNGSDEATTQTVADLAGHRLSLSPVQARGSDPVVKGTTWNRATGTVTVPPRTVAVLVEKAGHGGWHWGR
jgi:hypothetical protein